MPTLTGADTALHGLTLTANTELQVDIERAPGTVELIVTTPGDQPVYWTADNTPATVTGRRTRVIPAGAVAVDTDVPVRIGQTYPSAVVRVITAGTATISVQKG